MRDIPQLISGISHKCNIIESELFDPYFSAVILLQAGPHPPRKQPSAASEAKEPMTPQQARAQVLPRELAALQSPAVKSSTTIVPVLTPGLPCAVTKAGVNTNCCKNGEYQSVH